MILIALSVCPSADRSVTRWVQFESVKQKARAAVVIQWSKFHRVGLCCIEQVPANSAMRLLARNRWQTMSSIFKLEASSSSVCHILETESCC
eukprot:3485874-Pleurochrysis_carterae.AAC.4